MTRRKGGDETWFRLLNWTKGQKDEERLAVQLLRVEGYASIDPSHPLGGKDGGKDALAIRDSKTWIIAVYFSRGQQQIRDINKKFQEDLKGVQRNQVNGIVFVTNQELRLKEREDIKKIARDIDLDLFHLERVANLLDSPQCYGLRLEFLDIEMTKEEQLSFFAWRQSEDRKIIQSEMRENMKVITGMMTGADSFCYLSISSINPHTNVGILVFVHQGEFPLYNASARIVELKENSNTIEEMQILGTTMDLGDLTPNHAVIRDSWLLGNANRKRYNVFFTARNGSFTQQLRLVRVGDRWVTANRVIRDDKTLFENVDQDYPVTDLGTVDW